MPPPKPVMNLPKPIPQNQPNNRPNETNANKIQDNAGEVLSPSIVKPSLIKQNPAQNTVQQPPVLPVKKNV